MFSLLALVFIGFGFVVLLLTFFWISHLQGRGQHRHDGIEKVQGAAQESSAGAMVHRANYGLVLGILACTLFKILAPLMLILSAAGLVYSGRALWEGLSRYQIVMYRALFGLLLSIVSFGLHYLELTQSWPTELVP